MNSVERGTVTVEPNGAVRIDAAATYPKSIVIGWLVPFEGMYNTLRVYQARLQVPPTLHRSRPRPTRVVKQSAGRGELGRV